MATKIDFTLPKIQKNNIVFFSLVFDDDGCLAIFGEIVVYKKIVKYIKNSKVCKRIVHN